MATGYRPTRQEFDSYYASKGYNTDEIDQWWDANYKFDSWDAFKTGLNHGYQGLKYSAGSLGNAALGGDFGQQTMAEAQQAIGEDELPPELQGRIWDKTGLLADPRTWAYGLGSVGPSVGLSVGTGGLGYLATGSRWAAAFATGATEGALVAGPTYAEAIEMGQSQDEARMSGLAMGLATIGLSALPAARLFGPVGKLGRLGKATQVGMAQAVTEVAEGPVEAVILGKDVYEALKDEANVAPGALLSGMILGSFGKRVSVPDAYEAGMALGGDPEMIIPSEKEMLGQMGPSREDMIRLQEDMTHRQREEEGMWMQWDQKERTLQQQENQMWLEQEHEKEQGIQVSAKKEALYRKAEQARALDEAIKLEQEEEAFNILEPALELPKEVEIELIASKVANVYAGKELNQMQLAFSKALNQLPDGVQEGFNRAMPQEAEQQQRDDPERLLPPIAETVSDNPAVAQDRAVELEQFASHGTSPLQEVTPVEEQAMEQAMENLAEPPELRSYPPGVGITPTPQGFQVMGGGQPVATFPKLRQAEIYAQLSAPDAVAMDEPMVPIVDAMEPTVDRDTRVQRSYAKVILDTPATSSRLQVGPKTLPLLNNKLVEKSEGVSVGSYGTFKQANYAQSVMFDRAIDNLTAWGMPAQSFAGLDGMMVHEKDGIAPMGAYVTYKNGKRLLSMDADLMDLGFIRNESELVTQSFAHELGHHVGNEYALQSELFTPGGDIIDELAYVYRGRDPRRVWAELQYPMIHMEDIADNPSLIPMIAKESFAQIHGIYYTYGSTAEGRAYLKDLMPRSIQLMDEVKNAINSATTQQRATALQKAFRLRNPDASHSPVVAGTLVADFDGGLGGRQTSGRVQGTENAGSFRRDSFDRYITVKGQTPRIDLYNDGLRYTDFESYRKPNGKVYAEVAKQGFESPASVRKGIDAGLKKLESAEPGAFTFYEDLGKYLNTVSNGDRAELDRMARTIALLSTDNSTATDFNWWLKATNAIQTAERDGAPMAEIADTFSQYPEQMRTYIEAATKARTFTQEIPGVGPKVQGFYRSLMDAATGENQFPNAAVADSDSFRAMGGTGKAKIDPRVNRLGNEMIRQITDEYNQTTGSNWLPRNIQSALTTQGVGNAAKYAAGLEDRAGTVTVTTEPSSSMGEWVTGLSSLQSQQFDTGAKKLITGKNGEDLLAKVLGIPGFNGFLPDNQLQGAAALRTSQKFNRNQVRAYTQSLQYIYQQEAVPWARPDPNGNNVGVVLQTKGALSDLELEDLHNKVENSIQKAAFTRIGQESILLVNHANDPAFAQKVDAILANQSKIKAADLVGVEAEYGADHNWTDDPRGKGLLENIVNTANTTPGNSGRDPSVLRKWLLDRHAAYARYVTEQREALSADSKNPIASVDLMQEPEHEPRVEPSRPDTEYAGSVNRKHWTPTDLENEADVWDTTKGLSDEFETEFTKHRRGQRSWGTTERAAAALGMSETQLIKSKLGTTGNAEQLERARFMAMRAAQDLTAANSAYQETHSDQAAMELHKTRARAALIIRSYQGLATEAGRALNILRKDTAVIKNVGRALEDLGGKEQLDQFSKMLEQMQTTGKINKFADDSLKATTSDVLLELWINALLSGPQTHAVNVFSNGLVSMFSDLETFVAAGIGKLHGGNKISFREAASYTTGTLEGALKGLKLAGTAFKTEIPSGVGKIEARRYQAISAENLDIKGEKIGKTVDKIGRIVRIPGRGLLAGDELFKSVARTKKLHQIAMRNALQDAKNSAQVRTLYKQNREAPTEEMLDEAQDWADYQTFTKELGSFGKHIQQLANKHPLMRVLIPFIRTPTNIVKFALERSPGAVIFKEVRDDLMGKNGNIKRDEAASRVLIGSSIGALVAYLTAQGLITGGGPEDGRERNAMRARGWQPYSFMVGDEYIAFNRLEPLGMLFGISADMVEVSDVLEKNDQANIASLITISIAKNLTSKTWLRGISEAVNALTDPERYGPYYIRNLLGTLVPTGVAQIARVDDPLLRDAQNIVDKWKSRIPGMTSQVPMKYDIFGNEIRLEGGIGPDIISPIYTSRIKSDPVFNAMKEIEYYPGKPTRKILGIKLKPDQYAEYSRLSGKGAYRMLHDLVRLRGYRMLPSHEKERIMKKAYRESRKMARLLLIKRFPDLALQLRAVEARRQAERQRSPMGQQIYQAVGVQ